MDDAAAPLLAPGPEAMGPAAGDASSATTDTSMDTAGSSNFWFNSASAAAVAGICAITAAVLAIFHIIQHLRHYTEPMFQRYIIRIIFMVPVYAVCSFASLLAEDASIYIATIRDCYEAWIIYNFMSLCLEYVGGPGAVEIKMQGVVLLPSWSACTCCLSPLQVNGQFIRSVKRGALQFVIVKPILAILTVILYATGHYTEGDWSVSGSYLWITIVYNVTYTVALYALLLFYMGTHELLEPFRPLLKFILVKSVIFLTYWQGLIISIFVGVSIIPSAEDGNAVQNWLTSVEMLPAAIFMLFAFPWKEFASDAPTGLGRTQALHAMSVGDVVTDTMHQFAPTYQNYVLYSDGTAKGGPGGAFGKSYAGPMMQSHESDPGLLYDVEMSPYYDEATHPSADPAAKGTNATAASSHGMGRFLQRDESAEQARRPVSKAEQRWNDINVGEG